MIENTYAQRPLLRKFEYFWSRVESFVNRLTTSKYNPLYHLGTLSVYLLIVITVTGIYLTIIYRPGTEKAYATVAAISANWFGSLIRSIHRYASDGFLLLVLLHGLKTLLSDRYWGSRWLAWVSGWVMVVSSWFIGTTGYWLVWDQRAQWLTEYLINNVGGGVALTFLAQDLDSSTFIIFVIILFVHVFLPIILLGLFIVHILRLMRARIWSPRWVVILSTLALVLLSLLKPVSSAQPANLNRFIESVTLDAWYLGFLPLIDTYGSLPFWGFTVALFAVATLLPWLAKGKHDGPAVVENSECTGCALCATECPYRAIEMDYRHDDTSRFKSLAFVNPNMCTGCGLCVGTCATLGIELQGVPTLPLYDHGLLSALKQSVAAGAAPTVIFTCQRHAALGSLPSSAGLNQWQPAEHPGVQPPVYLGASTTQSGSAITCVLPCIGMVDVDWVKELFAYGAADIALLGCPLDDCNYREGPLWLSRRLSRRKAILKPNLHWLSAAPGDKKALAQFLKRSPDQPKSAKPVLPYFKLRQLAFPKFPSAAMALLVLSLLFASALPLDMTSRSPFAHQSQLRFGIEHQGVVTLGESLQDFELPEGVVVNPGQLSTGKHHPVQLRVEVDGQTALQQTFQPRGLHNDGEIDGVETITLAPGVYSVQIFMNDDSEDWRLIYSGELELGTAQIVTFMYAQDTDSFILH